MDATATVNEQNAEGELQANPDMLLISKPKADWSVRDFRDSIEELASVEAAGILLSGDASVALLRKAGLVNDPTGPNPNAYTLDPRFNGLTAEDAKRMRQNAGKYAKALKGYRTSMKRISASGPVQVSYRIGGVLYIEEVHVSPSGEFTPAAYLAKVPDAPRNMTLSVHSQNVSASGIPALPNPEMLWDGVSTATNRLMQGENQEEEARRRARRKKLAFERAYAAVNETASEHTVTGKTFSYEKPTSRSESRTLFRRIAPRGTFTNTDSGIAADFGRKYTGEIAGHDWSNEAHLASIMDSPRIYENALYVGRFRVPDGRLFDYYLSIFDYTGNRYLVRSSVRFDQNAAYYDHKLSNETKIKDWSESSFRISSPGLDSTNPSIIEDTRLQRFLQEDITEETELISSPFVSESEPDSLFLSAIEDTDEWRNTEAMLKENAANFNAAGMPLAPNGQISKLPYREWVTVRTPSFLNWFGDWMNNPENASKVVDENGEPMVVYHGTPNATFTVFDPEMGDRLYGDMYHKKPDAVWFSDSTEVVDSVYYVDDSAFPDKKGIYSVFLNLRNPVLLDAEGNPWNRLPYPEGMPKRTNPDFRPGGRGSEFYEASTDTVAAWAKDNGFDGVIFSNIIDGSYDKPLSTVYSAFRSNQIKSVDNHGTFDASDPDILYQSFNEKIEALRGKYNMPLEEREQWKGKLPADIFSVRKQLITDIFMEYPKVRLGNVAMLQGLDYGDMPFQKELIQTEMLQLILGEPVILLPRYADKTLNRVLGTSLREGSIPDGIAITADSGKYVDYKAIVESNIIRRINKAASEGADIAFAAVDKLSGNWQARFASPSSQLNVPDGFEAYIYSIADGRVYIARKNKGLSIESLAGGQEHDSRLRMLSSALIGYIQGSDAVKNARCLKNNLTEKKAENQK